MNQYQQSLYNNLMSLTASGETFYYADCQHNDTWFRIFNYRLASYTEFLQPGALECRGTMFQIDRPGDEAIPVRLASIQIPKFFNLNENPSTTDMDLHQVTTIMAKMDGSLISTYSDGDSVLRLKTKGSLGSTQAIAAMNWLDLPENQQLKRELAVHEHMLGHTVNMEWCSMDNRIVISYDKPRLTILNIRSRDTGEFIDLMSLCPNTYPMMTSHSVQYVITDNSVAFIKSIPDMTAKIEGYVCQMNNGMRFKCKTDQYVHLHHCKDSVNSPKKLFSAVVYETTDDLRSLFVDDLPVLNKIAEMEAHVNAQYNHVISTVEQFYTNNAELTRKEYAILGQRTLDNVFSLAMSKYLEREIDYKQFMIKQYDIYKLPGSVEPDNKQGNI